jgi:hypothetical protein
VGYICLDGKMQKQAEATIHGAERPRDKPILMESEEELSSVVLETSLGDIQLELYWQHAPRVSIALHYYYYSLN